VLAKIESCESLQNLEEIIRVSDGAMVARGDLGAQIPLEQVPSVQQDVVQLCRQLNKPVIVASQLLDSMIEYPTPTRAEVPNTNSANSVICQLLQPFRLFQLFQIFQLIQPFKQSQLFVLGIERVLLFGNFHDR
jgi:hypothetical protein